MKRTPLESVSQIAFIVMCLTVTGAGARYVLGTREPAPPTRAPAISTGTQLPSSSKFNPRGAKATIVLALSTECRFCTESLPFYGRLAGLSQVKGGQVQLSVASVQKQAPMSEYLLSHDLRVPTIVAISESALRIAVTPTLILTDEVGRVIKVWEGKLLSAAEEEVVEFVLKAAGG